MTNQEILDIALTQSAIDCSCHKDDFLSEQNIVTVSKINKKARCYLTLPFECNLVSYGNNIVASVNPKYTELIKEYINRYPAEHCFETPNLYVLNDLLKNYNSKVCFMNEYFLPDIDLFKVLPCKYEVRILEPSDFHNLYKPRWSNALCKNRSQYDILAAGAYDGNKLIGLAGCSADCENMWQIGIDVLPEYRKMGIASALTSRIAYETLTRNKVPFYCAAWSNIKSVRNAIKSGFRPAWTELNIRSVNFISNTNKSL